MFNFIKTFFAPPQPTQTNPLAWFDELEEHVRQLEKNDRNTKENGPASQQVTKCNNTCMKTALHA